MNLDKADKIYRKVLISLFIVVAITGLVKAIYYQRKGITEELDNHFEGVVDSVSYDIKGKASVIIKGTHFYLGDGNWDFDHNRIEKGDSLIKKRNSMIIKLKRPNGQVVIEGEEL